MNSPRNNYILEFFFSIRVEIDCSKLDRPFIILKVINTRNCTGKLKFLFLLIKCKIYLFQLLFCKNYLWERRKDRFFSLISLYPYIPNFDLFIVSHHHYHEDLYYIK